MTPRYEVVIWYKADPAQDLPERIIAQVGKKPHERFEMQGHEDMHFVFKTGDSAIKCAERLFEFAAMDSVVKLVVNGYGDEAFERKVYKDKRLNSAAGNTNT